jgi:hypothetical protein
VQSFLCLRDLFIREFARPAEGLATAAGGGEAFLCAARQDAPLELGHTGQDGEEQDGEEQDGEEQVAFRRSRVEPEVGDAETDAFLVEDVDLGEGLSG